MKAVLAFFSERPTPPGKRPAGTEINLTLGWRELIAKEVPKNEDSFIQLL